MPIGSQLWSLGVWLFAIEYLADCLAFVRCQGCNEDQQLNSFADVGTYHSPGIGVRNKDHRPIGPLQRAPSAATSFDSDVNGIGAARVLNPMACSGLMTWVQLEPSAQAPWTSTMLAVVFDPCISIATFPTG